MNLKASSVAGFILVTLISFCGQAGAQAGPDVVDSTLDGQHEGHYFDSAARRRVRAPNTAAATRITAGMFR